MRTILPLLPQSLWTEYSRTENTNYKSKHTLPQFLWIVFYANSHCLNFCEQYFTRTHAASIFVNRILRELEMIEIVKIDLNFPRSLLIFKNSQKVFWKFIQTPPYSMTIPKQLHSQIKIAINWKLWIKMANFGLAVYQF